jgi:hypothetical protein
LPRNPSPIGRGFENVRFGFEPPAALSRTDLEFDTTPDVFNSRHDMRARGFSIFLILAAAVGTVPAFAQAKRDVKPTPPANEVRYFTSISGIMDEQGDGILKETHTAGKVTAAVLDVCYPSVANSEPKDRFVIPLTVDGQKLTGNGETISRKRPVSVNLTRKPTSSGVTFEGKITVGDNVSNISSTDNTDVSEKEFRESQDADNDIIPAPTDFATASPEAVAVRIKPEAVAEFVNGLRGQNIELSLISLLPSCAELRKDEQVVHLNIDPERAAAFVAKMQSTSGIIAAGWTGGKFEMERTVRFPAANWRDGGKINKDKLAATLSSVMAKALSATALSSTWNDDNGELKLVFKRPNSALPGLGLTQTIQISATAANDKPDGSDRLLLWIGYPSIITTDESTGPKLKLSDASDNGGGEENVPIDEGETVTAVARALKAQRWDAENASWK